MLKSEVNVFFFFSYILVPSVETFSHIKTTILLVLQKRFLLQVLRPG